MKITVLVENLSKCELKSIHGLALYIETKEHKILFDLGPDNTLFENAKMRNIDLSQVDIVVISHGHGDHGGALSKFLEINKTAKIYVQRKAFESHYGKFFLFKTDIGINKKMKDHEQVILLDGDYKIDDELTLFTVKEIDKCFSPANAVLYDESGKDNFSHEQNLVIKEKEATLIMGCGHCGVVNILKKAEDFKPKVCVGGYHLMNPTTKKSVPTSLLDEIAKELKSYTEIQFYTCHCTGQEAYKYLSKKMDNLHYISCGESIEVN